MKSYSAFFARAENLDRALEIFGEAEPIEGTAWLLCAYDVGASPPNDDVLWGRESLTLERSKQVGEIVFVYGDTSTEGFVYEHARDGELLRKLVWFPMLDEDWTAGWLCVVGTPEDWEQVLFRPDKLESYVDLERMRYEDEGRESEFASREAEIRRSWAGGRIEAGTAFPSCDGTVALVVERSFGIDRGLA